MIIQAKSHSVNEAGNVPVSRVVENREMKVGYIQTHTDAHTHVHTHRGKKKEKKRYVLFGAMQFNY